MNAKEKMQKIRETGKWEEPPEIDEADDDLLTNIAAKVKAEMAAEDAANPPQSDETIAQ